MIEHSQTKVIKKCPLCNGSNISSSNIESVNEKYCYDCACSFSQEATEHDLECVETFKKANNII